MYLGGSCIGIDLQSWLRFALPSFLHCHNDEVAGAGSDGGDGGDGGDDNVRVVVKVSTVVVTMTTAVVMVVAVLGKIDWAFCARNCVKYFIYILLFYPHNNSMKEVLLWASFWKHPLPISYLIVFLWIYEFFKFRDIELSSLVLPIFLPIVCLSIL